MDIKEIQKLIDLVSKSGISELKVKEGEFEVEIKGFNPNPQTYPMPQMQMAMPTMMHHAAPPVTAEEKAEQPVAAQPISDNTFTFKSPMIGTFYRKPSADKDPFVKVGDTIKTGDVLCIIEAMKLFNEIEFDGVSGKIVKILTDDSSPVEYDQPLFLIEKI